jgi:hypothetical protein
MTAKQASENSKSDRVFGQAEPSRQQLINKASATAPACSQGSTPFVEVENLRDPFYASAEGDANREKVGAPC